MKRIHWFIIGVPAIVLTIGLIRANVSAVKQDAPQVGKLITITPPLGLPPVPIPSDNPITQEKIDLGRKLFMDRRLSFNGTMACVMCHVPEQGFTSNELGTSIGTEGRSLKRNAPTNLNAAYSTSMFHDGNESTLENQIWGPLLNINEMANPSIGHVIKKIRKLADYDGLFEGAFGEEPDVKNIGQAIATYERTLISGNSRFDRWFYGKEDGALTNQEKRGFELFRGRANCISCHSVGSDSALFTDNHFHNTGIGWIQGEKQKSPAKMHRVEISPGVFTEISNDIVQSFSEIPENDIGRFEVTENPDDRWAYRTPTLRNIALTAPYMHDGSLATLEEVIDFYQTGGAPNPELDPLMQPLGLSDREKADLVAFLKALTGDNIDDLIKKARQPSVGSKSPNP